MWFYLFGAMKIKNSQINQLENKNKKKSFPPQYTRKRKKKKKKKYILLLHVT
jgi:hypothetical protein